MYLKVTGDSKAVGKALGSNRPFKVGEKIEGKEAQLRLIYARAPELFEKVDDPYEKKSASPKKSFFESSPKNKVMPKTEKSKVK